MERKREGRKMSLRAEQYYALKKTREFLRELLVAKTRPKTSQEFKDKAYSCLRHFPYLDEHGKPMFSQDDFGPDKL